MNDYFLITENEMLSSNFETCSLQAIGVFFMIHRIRSEKIEKKNVFIPDFFLGFYKFRHAQVFERRSQYVS